MPEYTARHVQEVRDMLAEMLLNLDWEVGMEISQRQRVSENCTMLAKVFRDEYNCGKKRLEKALRKNKDFGETFVKGLMDTPRFHELFPSLVGRVKFEDKNMVCGTYIKEHEKVVPMKRHDGKK